MMKNHSIIGITALLLVNLPAHAQQTPTACQTDETFRAFDFWIGDWDVTDNSTGQAAGTNSIRAIEGGCALEERWTNTTGGTGRSLNYYNPVTKEWRQVWVSAGAYAIDVVGDFKDGAMQMKGSIYYYSTDQSFPFTGSWRPNGDGSVRQYFEQYNPETKTWVPWFDGHYTKK